MKTIKIRDELGLVIDKITVSSRLSNFKLCDYIAHEKAVLVTRKYEEKFSVKQIGPYERKVHLKLTIRAAAAFVKRKNKKVLSAWIEYVENHFEHDDFDYYHHVTEAWKIVTYFNNMLSMYDPRRKKWDDFKFLHRWKIHQIQATETDCLKDMRNLSLSANWVVGYLVKEKAKYTYSNKDVLKFSSCPYFLAGLTVKNSFLINSVDYVSMIEERAKYFSTVRMSVVVDFIHFSGSADINKLRQFWATPLQYEFI